MMHLEDETKNRSVATFLSPIGKTWIIKLTRDHSEIFFKGGWPEFSKCHKLEVGFKLVFRYEGNMVFNVKVFGLNGCLKDYNQDAVAILRRTSSSSVKQTKRKHDLLIDKETPHHDRSKMRKALGTATNSYVKKKRNKNVISVSHQTLITRMSHANIHNFMPLPKIFGSVLPYNLEKGEITVKNEKQETLKIQFNTPATGNYNNLCRGWKDLCWKNHIKCGDTCTLKITDHNEILVTISKAAKPVETIDVKSEIETSWE
ncbi:B3 domain-containing protein [Carex littledalei]|uniref:B3 domain-containing protein n=1 Tax=Carex littledalei TaxID=544730 RepID=A0A833QT64_9POAL|nr:B3 domain-containing protein [Carex littledalei]